MLINLCMNFWVIKVLLISLCRLKKITVITLFEGCLIPNCEQRLWKIKSTKNHGVNNQSKSMLKYVFPHYTKVLVREEIKLYTFSSFWADVGGYLGLLLGESMVSYVLLGTHWMSKMFKKWVSELTTYFLKSIYGYLILQI